MSRTQIGSLVKRAGRIAAQRPVERYFDLVRDVFCVRLFGGYFELVRVSSPVQSSNGYRTENNNNNTERRR